jgi:Rhodanese-like domain
MTARKLRMPVLGICVAAGIIGTDRIPASTQTKSDQTKAPDVQTITAEELKVKLAKKDPVTILDVRASDSYVSSENKIEGAIFVRFRRLRSWLAPNRLSRMFPRSGNRHLLCLSKRGNQHPCRACSHGSRLPARAGFEGGWQAWLKANGQWDSRPKGP